MIYSPLMDRRMDAHQNYNNMVPLAPFGYGTLKFETTYDQFKTFFVEKYNKTQEMAEWLVEKSLWKTDRIKRRKRR